MGGMMGTRVIAGPPRVSEPPDEEGPGDALSTPETRSEQSSD